MTVKTFAQLTVKLTLHFHSKRNVSEAAGTYVSSFDRLLCLKVTNPSKKFRTIQNKCRHAFTEK